MPQNDRLFKFQDAAKRTLKAYQQAEKKALDTGDTRDLDAAASVMDRLGPVGERLSQQEPPYMMAPEEPAPAPNRFNLGELAIPSAAVLKGSLGRPDPSTPAETLMSVPEDRESRGMGVPAPAAVSPLESTSQSGLELKKLLQAVGQDTSNMAATDLDALLSAAKGVLQTTPALGASEGGMPNTSMQFGIRQLTLPRLQEAVRQAESSKFSYEQKKAHDLPVDLAPDNPASSVPGPAPVIPARQGGAEPAPDWRDFFAKLQQAPDQSFEQELSSRLKAMGLDRDPGMFDSATNVIATILNALAFGPATIFRQQQQNNAIRQGQRTQVGRDLLAERAVGPRRKNAQVLSAAKLRLSQAERELDRKRQTIARDIRFAENQILGLNSNNMITPEQRQAAIAPLVDHLELLKKDEANLDYKGKNAQGEAVIDQILEGGGF